jgi:hypothetical protein
MAVARKFLFGFPPRPVNNETIGATQVRRYILNMPAHCIRSVVCKSTNANMAAMGNFEVRSRELNVSLYRMCSEVMSSSHNENN